MIVTTAGRENEKASELAKQLSSFYKLQFVERDKRSMKKIFEIYQTNILMIGSEKIELQTPDDRLRYHPNFAQVRIKRLLNGEEDPFIEATNLKRGSSIIDCTMGMLSDSLVASYIVGKTGSVTAVEAMFDIYLPISMGAKKYRHSLQVMNEAAQRIETVHMEALKYLKTQKDESVDVVYFDPMFEETVESSNGIKSLEKFAHHNLLTKEIIEEAKRVAKKRIVLKAHFRSPMFEEFGFMRCVRLSSVSHYGVIIKK